MNKSKFIYDLIVITTGVLMAFFIGEWASKKRNERKFHINIEFLINEISENTRTLNQITYQQDSLLSNWKI
ncbi:MAG: hypothetical protein MI866_16280, partial [Bacteroidales bacterium]|nr:hypothetical protein [Bacteroidales bacterium]